MKIIFAGTPEFAACALEAILTAGHQVPLVLTQPDRPSGRGMHPGISAVKQVALAHGLPLFQPQHLKEAVTREPLQATAADLMVVAAYGLILPQAVLDIPRLGCVNIHASLLPRWRGAAPIQRAIEAGDAATGITLMRMEAGLDTGPILLQERLDIALDDNAASLHDKLAVLGARLMVAALRDFDHLHPMPQPAEGVSYARKIDKAEAALDWRQPAALLVRRIRAFDPFPGTSGVFRGTPVKLKRAVAVEGEGAPGRVLAVAGEGITVACGEGALRLGELQRPGGKFLSAREFVKGFPIAVGDHFALPD